MKIEVRVSTHETRTYSLVVPEGTTEADLFFGLEEYLDQDPDHELVDVVEGDLDVVRGSMKVVG